MEYFGMDDSSDISPLSDEHLVLHNVRPLFPKRKKKEVTSNTASFDAKRRKKWLIAVVMIASVGIVVGCSLALVEFTTNEMTISSFQVYNAAPTAFPSVSATPQHTEMPSLSVSSIPTVALTGMPTVPLTPRPTGVPSFQPSLSPTIEPTGSPTGEPTDEPTEAPTPEPSETEDPTLDFSEPPTDTPTIPSEVTEIPTEAPTIEPEETEAPTIEPEETEAPTETSELDGGVTELVLIDISQDEEYTLQDGDVFSLSDNAGPDFNVEAVTEGDVDYVIFIYNGFYFNTENFEPYLFCGNEDDSFNACYDLTEGAHTISATAFTEDGEEYPSLTVSFFIVA